jgi:hypothetical protein
MTKPEALIKARETNRPQMFQDPGPHGDHGMVQPCGCVIIAVGFSGEKRWEYCQECRNKRYGQQ